MFNSRKPLNPILPAYLIARGLLILLLVAGIYFLRSFILPGLAALIIGFASWPIYLRLEEKCNHRTAVSATIALIIVIAVLVVPLSFVLSYAIKEAISIVNWLEHANRDGMSVPEWVRALPMVGERLEEYWDDNLASSGAIGEWLREHSGQHLGNISRMLLSATGNIFNRGLAVLFMLVILFFVYKDGRLMVSQLDRIGKRILPGHWLRVSRIVPATVSATVTGMCLIAIGEGIVLGIAYWIAGVPSPVLCGVITGLMAMVPGGAPVSFTLISLYLIGSGHTIAGIGLFTWGTVELFIVDKTLRPRLVGGPVKLPFLPTFCGLVGGVKTMGFVGLFVGPVLMALLVSIWREWLHQIEEERKHQLALKTMKSMRKKI